MTNLQEASLMSQFSFVGFNIPLCRAKSMLQLVKTRSQYYFSIQRYGILKTVETSNFTTHNSEERAAIGKEPYLTSFKCLKDRSGQAVPWAV